MGRQRKLIGGGLSEPESGGDWGLFATKARRDGEAYVLNGRKVFTSLSPVVDFFMVMATVEDDGPLSSATFPVARNAPGLELVETWDAMGMRATASHDLILKNVRVPAAAMADRRPVGPLGADAISLFAWFELSIAAVYTGVAIAAINFTREFAQRFKPITLERPISYLPGVQFAMAQAQALLAQSRALYLSTAREYLDNRDSFSRRRRPGAGDHSQVRRGQQRDSIVDHCMEIAGAHGFLRRNPLERLFRDVRAGINHPLSNARAREFIGKSALGIPMSTTPTMVAGASRSSQLAFKRPQAGRAAGGDNDVAGLQPLIRIDQHKAAQRIADALHRQNAHPESRPGVERAQIFVLPSAGS